MDVKHQLLMKKRSITLVATAGLFALVAAFLVGVRVGVNQFMLMESTIKATMLVGELKALRSGNKTEELINSKELELDTQVFLYAHLLKSGHPWLFWPDSKSFEHERYLRNIAAYRKDFPALKSRTHIGGNAELSQAMRASDELIERTTNDIVRRFGRK